MVLSIKNVRRRINKYYFRLPLNLYLTAPKLLLIESLINVQGIQGAEKKSI